MSQSFGLVAPPRMREPYKVQWQATEPILNNGSNVKIIAEGEKIILWEIIASTVRKKWRKQGMKIMTRGGGMVGAIFDKMVKESLLDSDMFE